MNNLSSILNNLRELVKDNQNDLILVFGVILISLISFGAGRLTAPISVAPEEIVIEKVDPNDANYKASAGQVLGEGESDEKLNTGYVASVNGTKYHLPECSGAKRIKEENKIWFSSKEEAERMGYTPAANCPGI